MRAAVFRPSLTVATWVALCALAGCDKAPAPTPASTLSSADASADPAPSSPSAAETRSAPAAQTPAPAASGAIVIRAEPGGKNPTTFCMPQWSIANESGQDIGALLIQLEWRNGKGDVLEPVGPMGTMVDQFKAGKRKDLSLNGYTAACSDLQLVVRTYACRNADAVRMPCPGPLRSEVQGGLQVDLSAAAEGSMKGAVEPR